MWLGGKYVPLVKTAALIGAGLLILIPISLILRGATFSMWASAYEKAPLLFFVLGTLANFMAWLLCELFYFGLPRLLAAGIFGILSPLVFLVLLGLAMFFERGVFLEGAMSTEGLKNVGLIFGLLSPVCLYIYLGFTKNT